MRSHVAKGMPESFSLFDTTVMLSSGAKVPVRRRLVLHTAILFQLLLLASCEVPPPPAGPIDLTASGDAMIDLPVDSIGDMRVPPKAKATFSVELHADTIQAKPQRSAYSGSVHLLVTDITGVNTFLRFDTETSGQYDGSPDSALSQFTNTIEKAIDTVGAGWPATTTTRPAGESTQPSAIEIHASPIEIHINGQ